LFPLRNRQPFKGFGFCLTGRQMAKSCTPRARRMVRIWGLLAHSSIRRAGSQTLQPSHHVFIITWSLNLATSYFCSTQRRVSGSIVCGVSPTPGLRMSCVEFNSASPSREVTTKPLAVLTARTASTPDHATHRLALAYTCDQNLGPPEFLAAHYVPALLWRAAKRGTQAGAGVLAHCSGGRSVIAERGLGGARRRREARPARKQQQGAALRRKLGQAAGALGLGDVTSQRWRLANDRRTRACQGLDFHHAPRNLKQRQFAGWLLPVGSEGAERCCPGRSLPMIPRGSEAHPTGLRQPAETDLPIRGRGGLFACIGARGLA